MSTEQKILEQILKEGGNASVGSIAKKLKMNNGHIDYLCKVLLKKGLIKKMEKNTWYQVVHEGKKIEEMDAPEVAEGRQAEEPSKSKTTKDGEKIVPRFHKAEPKIFSHPVVKKRGRQIEDKSKQEGGETQKRKAAALLKEKLKRWTEFFKNFINRRRTPKIL